MQLVAAAPQAPALQVSVVWPICVVVFVGAVTVTPAPVAGMSNWQAPDGWKLLSEGQLARNGAGAVGV